jgi:GT2 family glycosyltransferase
MSADGAATFQWQEMAAGVPGTTQRICIAICTKDRPDDLMRAVQSIRDSSALGRSVDVLVVEEADEPRAIQGIRYVRIPTRGLGFGYARNVAVQHAEADVIVFLDDDCVAERGWLEALVAPFAQDASVLGVAGAVLVHNCGPIGYAENILGFPGGGLRYLHLAAGRVGVTRHLSTCNCAYRRSSILQAGGFPETAPRGGEDALLAQRVTRHGSCVYAPDAVVYHRTRDSLPAVCRWFMRRGESEVAMLGTVQDRSAHLLYLLRSSWSLRLLLMLLVLGRWPVLLAVLPVLVMAYYGAMLWRFRFARRYATHRDGWMWVPVVKATMDLGTEIGRWKAVMRSREP